MNRAAAVILWIFGVLSVAGTLLAFAQFRQLAAPREWHDTILWVKQGEGRPAIAADIAALSGMPLLSVQAAVRLTPTRPLQAGEYDLSKNPSALSVLGDMQAGRFIHRSVTIPEGLTSYQIIGKLKEAYGLEPDCPDYKALPEGSLLPETYAYTRGEKCSAMLFRMKNLMDEKSVELWKNRDPNVPYANWQQAVTMASIVEKETGVPAERPVVAGVFVNRLRLGMPLQSDPTTIYALSNGTGDLGRALTRADWKVANPYNTYTIPALPPGPIAHPGLASLTAALHPQASDYLFFVANGTGGHAFARTLGEHVKNERK